MKVSLNWLKRHVELPESVDAVEKKLTAIGLEVEGRDDQGSAYSALIVAKVVAREKHPDSDHLSVTKVFDGKEELQVVCGAPNVAAGQTVVFAPLGCELPLPNGEKLKIKKAKIRGVESSGMICAEDEIGLSNDHAGIMVLPDHLQAGTPFISLGYYDVVFELNVTPNRPDALNHLGVARELAAAFGLPLRLPEFKLTESNTSTAERMQLSVDASCGCTRYVGRVIENVQVAPSPAWMQRLLRSVDVTPVNNVVDITNFVLFDIGQPLHSFDMDRLAGSVIHVRKAQNGEKIVTIDHKENALQPTDLVICDGDRPACVAGVMGGAESEIGDGTTRVFLESAWFQPTVVRKQAKRLGLSTDSSYRFERGIDPFMQTFASDYASALIAELAGGSILSGRLEFTAPDHQAAPAVVGLRVSRVAKVLGIAPTADEIRKLLTGIGLVEKMPCGCAPADHENLQFHIPGFRPDLEREIDLIEEIARLVGFDNIPYDTPRFQAEINDLPAQERLGRKIRYTLAAMGLHECLSLRFSNKKLVENVFGAPGDDRRSRPAVLLNPLSEDLGVLPTSLVPNLLRDVAENAKNRPGSVRLFEVGKAQFPVIERRSDRDPGFDEVPLLSFVLAGHWNTRALPEKSMPVDFAQAKGVVAALCKRLSIPVEIRPSTHAQSWLHPHRQAEVACGKKVLGYFGEVHPLVLRNFDIDLPAYVCELDLSVAEACIETRTRFVPFSRQVPTTRDISLEVDEKLTHAEVVAKIKGLNPKNLVDISLKSLYQGDKIAAGKKNLLYQLTYQTMDRTLTDDEVNKAHDKLREKLASDAAIALR